MEAPMIFGFFYNYVSMNMYYQLKSPWTIIRHEVSAFPSEFVATQVYLPESSVEHEATSSEQTPNE